ncbi:MAG TPA: ATP synthase subunit I [Clostridia bacterium]|nr:ATP synthase subunit I [Clostridia bacterium]
MQNAELPSGSEESPRDLEAAPFTLDPVAESFYSAATARILKMMAWLALPAIAVALALNWRFGLGLALGCAISYQNFRWLAEAVNGLGDRIVNANSQESGVGIVVRFTIRLLLVALAAYAIFRITQVGLYGLLAGLFLPVAAVFCEAAYELFAATRRGL